MRTSILHALIPATIAASSLLVGCSDNSSGSSASPAGAGGSTAGNSAAGGATATGGSLGSGGNGASAGGAAPTGPGAKLKCESSGKDAWDTYGVAAFVAVNEEIFAEVGAEMTKNGTANLGDSFTKIGSGNPIATADPAPVFKGNLAAFLVFAYGGPTSIMYTDGKTYVGPQDMAAAHAGLNITSSQYDYFVTNIIVPSLIAKGVKHGAGGAADPDDVGSCFAPIVVDTAFKATIVNNGTGTGAGAALKCKSSGKNAWDTFGVGAFVKVNESMLAGVVAFKL